MEECETTIRRQGWARIVLGWETTWEHWVLLASFDFCIPFLPFLITPEKKRNGKNEMKKSKVANSNQFSKAVSHPSTNRAQHCLTSVIGRELVYSMWYGRCREKRVKRGIVLMQAALLGCEVRFCQLWNGVMQRGLGALGVQIGSFAAG